MPELHKSRLVRLARLVHEIKSNPRQTPSQLCRTLGISLARFFQDKALLEQLLGFRFRYNRRQASYMIEADPILPLSNLQFSEVFALILSVRQLSATEDHLLTYHAIEGIRKIVEGCQPAMRRFLRTVLEDIVLLHHFGCNPQILDDLRKACSEHHHLVIVYHHGEDLQKSHEIDPYQLFIKQRVLYLDAYDKQAQDFRVFRVNRIHQIHFTGVRSVLVPDYSFAARFEEEPLNLQQK